MSERRLYPTARPVVTERTTEVQMRPVPAAGTDTPRPLPLPPRHSAGLHVPAALAARARPVQLFQAWSRKPFQAVLHSSFPHCLGQGEGPGREFRGWRDDGTRGWKEPRCLSCHPEGGCGRPRTGLLLGQDANFQSARPRRSGGLCGHSMRLPGLEGLERKRFLESEALGVGKDLGCHRGSRPDMAPSVLPTRPACPP